MIEQNTLYRKHRPNRFSDVVGQTEAAEALREHLNDDRAHTYLISGPSGVGKTTLARIGATFINCGNPLEIDGATNTGIDEMRKIQELVSYRPLVAETKAVILDEAHRLSKQAWDSILKSIEEPPDYMYWFLCTTAPSKLPETVRTRSTPIRLKSIGSKELMILVSGVAKKEGYKLSEQILGMVVQQAQGSARAALVNLSLCASVGGDAKKAAKILQDVVESEPVIALCRWLMQQESWPKAMSYIEALEKAGESPESVRVQVLHYMASVAKNAADDKKAIAALQIMEQFCAPYESFENLAPLIISIGRVAFAPST